MKTKIHIYLIGFLLTLNSFNVVAQQQYPGTNIRGKVMTLDIYGRAYPLRYATVDLLYFNPVLQQWFFIQNTLTDAYGFYYFEWIKPDIYVIQINKSKNYNITVVMINYNIYRYQDIPILYF